MAGRKRHSAEDIVRKLRRADELTAEGKTGERSPPNSVSRRRFQAGRFRIGTVRQGPAGELAQAELAGAGDRRGAVLHTQFAVQGALVGLDGVQ